MRLSTSNRIDAHVVGIVCKTMITSNRTQQSLVSLRAFSPSNPANISFIIPRPNTKWCKIANATHHLLHRRSTQASPPLHLTVCSASSNANIEPSSRPSLPFNPQTPQPPSVWTWITQEIQKFIKLIPSSVALLKQLSSSSWKDVFFQTIKVLLVVAVFVALVGVLDIGCQQVFRLYPQFTAKPM